MRYKVLKQEHFSQLTPQRVQLAQYRALVEDEDMMHVVSTEGVSLSGWHENRCLAIAGFIPYAPHWYRAWAFFSDDAGPHMRGIVSKARQIIEHLPCVRIDMMVEDGFNKGFRFAELLGMERETAKPLRMIGALGEDQYVYARIKDVRT